MIVKFLSNKGTGSAQATMDYLLGKNQDREQAVVLQGDPKLTQQLADSLNFKHKYTVGVLSFQEQDLDENTKKDIMANFEKALFTGLEADQYNITWIQHRDKDRLELNFVVPKVELTTGKALNPYFDPVDRTRINAFKDYMNAKHDLHDPNDPANRQSVALNLNLPKDKKQLQEAITGYLMEKMGDGTITDRKSVLEAIQSDLGLSVARITPTSISIKDPINEKGRNIRLKGEIYAKDFRFSQEYSAENERASAEYRKNRESRVFETRAIFEKELERKREFNQQLYSSDHARNTAKHTQGNEIQDPSAPDLGISGGIDSQFGNRDIHASQDAQRTASRIATHRTEQRANASSDKGISQIGNRTESERNDLDTTTQRQESENRHSDKRQKSNNSTVSDYAKRLFENVQQLVTRARTAVKRIRQSDTREKSADSRAGELERAVKVFADTRGSANEAIDRSERQIEQSEQSIKHSEQEITRNSRQIQKGIEIEIDL